MLLATINLWRENEVTIKNIIYFHPAILNRRD